MTQGFGTFERIVLAFLLVWVISPPLQDSIICRILCVAALLFFLFKNRKMQSYSMAAMVVIILCVVLDLIIGDPVDRNMGLFLSISYGFCFMPIFETEDIKKTRFLIFLVFSTLTVWNVFTIKALLEDGHIMRYLVKNDSGYSPFGCGGYGHVYTLILVIPIALEIVMMKKSKIESLSVWAFLISSVYVTFKSGYLMAILLLIFECVLYWFLKANTHKNRPMAIFIFCVFCIAVLLNIESVLEMLIDSLPSGLMKYKLMDLYNIIIESESIADSGFGGRVERYTRDIGLIFQSPIWGVLSYNVIGKHSVILDSFAKYGIPIGCCLITALFKPFSYVKTVPAIKTIMITFFMLLLFNASAMSMGVLYLLLPILFRIINDAKSEHDDNICYEIDSKPKATI